MSGLGLGSYSSKTVLVAQRASGFNLEIELKNIILRRVSIFEFLHSQGQMRKSSMRAFVFRCSPNNGHFLRPAALRQLSGIS